VLSHFLTSSQRRLNLTASRLFRVLVLLLLAVVTAQIAVAAEINISRNQLPVNLGQYLDIYEDPERRLTIDDILTQDIPWQRSDEAIPTLGISESAFWFSLVVSSEDLAGENLMLVLEGPTLDRIDFYIAHDDQIVWQETLGDTVSFDEIALPYRIPVLAFDLAQQGRETRIYFQIRSQAGIEVPLQITSAEALTKDSQSLLAFFGGFFAFLSLCFALCTVLYYIMRERQFIAYTLFFGCTLIFFLSQTGMGRVWFWGGMESMNNRMAYMSGAGLIASICLIGQTVNLVNAYRDQVVIVLRFIALAMIPAIIYFLIIPSDQVYPGNIRTIMMLGLLVAVIVFFMTVLAAYQGSRSAVYLVCSWLLIMLAYSSWLVYKLEFIERSAASSVFGEALVILAALMVLLSLSEFVRSKNEEFVQARLETKAKGDFLRNVSREFLTPVHLILANSKRLLASQSNRLDEGTRQHVSTVIKQSDHLHNLINDLLEMAQLESDSFEPEFELVEMSHFLNEVRDMMLPSAMEKGLLIKTDFAAANLLVQTDQARLQHILMNTITNAIKFTDSGEIVIGYKAIYFKRRLGIEIFIRDTGRGMSEEFQQRMFEEFARERPDSESDPQGTGLGMVIVKRMVEKLGGEVQFDSARNKGSEFFFRLPLRQQYS
jgi:signal transduction histidine kinase